MDNNYIEGIKEFFLGANTPFGFVSYFDQVIKNKRDWHRFLIKGGPGTGKSSFMKSILDDCKGLSDDIEIIYCSSDPNSLDGVIFNDKKISIFDATSPHILEPIFPGAFDTTISICDCWNNEILNKNRLEVSDLFTENVFYQNQAINLLLSAYGLVKNNYDIIDKHIDKNSINNYVSEIINKEFKMDNNFGNGKETKRYLSAVSVGEVIFYKDTINKIADKKYIIDDPYGPIANRILSKIRVFLINSNIDIITCCCPISDGSKIDHILVPSLKMAFVTSNEYHNFVDDSCEIVNHNDFLKYIDYDLEQQIKFNKNQIKTIIMKVAMFVKHAKNTHDKLERCYTRAMNFNLVDEKLIETLKTIKLFLDT